MLTFTYPVPQDTLWLWVNSVVMTQKVSVSPRWAKGGGKRGHRILTFTILLFSFACLSPQLCLLFTDFVAGVPKGNLTYGYVRPTCPPIPSPALDKYKEPCTAVCEGSKSGPEHGL